MLRLDICDYSDACTVIKETTTVHTENDGAVDGHNRYIIFKNNASFTNCISKIKNILIGNAEDLDFVMSRHLVLHEIMQEIFRLIL